MNPITVTHTTGSYDIHVAPGISAGLAARVETLLPGRRLAVVTDPTIHARLTEAKLWPALDATLIEVPPGEGAKRRDEWARVTDRLLALEFGRDSALIAFGGGSIGDLTGFVAATYLRGIPFVQVPTTLLAMVDASVGGKVAVDTPAGKNLVGAFHPPAVVLADPVLLVTLPERTFREGLAEGVKHGAVADRDYFDRIVASAEALGEREPATIARFVRRSVEIKAGVVSRDELERGERASLNAGHTIAHALERLSDYSLPHGEAIAIGLVWEARIAERMGVAKPGLADRLAHALGQLGLPVAPTRRPALPALLAAMRSDKKNRGGRIRMSLLAEIGRPARDGDDWTIPVPDEVVGL